MTNFLVLFSVSACARPESRKGMKKEMDLFIGSSSGSQGERKSGDSVYLKMLNRVKVTISARHFATGLVEW